MRGAPCALWHLRFIRSYLPIIYSVDSLGELAQMVRLWYHGRLFGAFGGSGLPILHARCHLEPQQPHHNPLKKHVIRHVESRQTWCWAINPHLCLVLKTSSYQSPHSTARNGYRRLDRVDFHLQQGYSNTPSRRWSPRCLRQDHPTFTICCQILFLAKNHTSTKRDAVNVWDCLGGNAKLARSYPQITSWWVVGYLTRL